MMERRKKEDENIPDPKWVPVPPDPDAVRESARTRAELLSEIDQAFQDWYMAYTANCSRTIKLHYSLPEGCGLPSVEGLRASWRSEQVDGAIASMSDLAWIQGHIIGLLLSHIERKEYLWHPHTITGRESKAELVLVELAVRVRKRIANRSCYPMPVSGIASD